MCWGLSNRADKRKIYTDTCSDAQTKRNLGDLPAAGLLRLRHLSSETHTTVLASCFLPQPLLLLCDAEATWDLPNQILLFCLKCTVQVTLHGRKDPEGAGRMRLHSIPEQTENLICRSPLLKVTKVEKLTVAP